MSLFDLVDDLYAAFVDTLHEPLRVFALRLPFVLGLAPAPGIPWSRVFGHEVTLAAPAMFAEGAPGLPSAVVRDATMAHMLAVLEAFGTDRVEDGQVRFTPELMAVLGHMRRARDRALRRVWAPAVDPRLDFALADRKTIEAIREERLILKEGLSASFATYESQALGKQSVGFPATLALGYAAGWDSRRLRAVQETLAAIALGLQMHDDVVDWEGDHRRGGAWVVALARQADGELRDNDPDAVRCAVFASGILTLLLSKARSHFRDARRLAAALGVPSVAAWASTREAKLETLVTGESRSAGFAVRAHALGPWAAEVLA